MLHRFSADEYALDNYNSWNRLIMTKTPRLVLYLAHELMNILNQPPAGLFPGSWGSSGAATLTPPVAISYKHVQCLLRMASAQKDRPQVASLQEKIGCAEPWRDRYDLTSDRIFRRMRQVAKRLCFGNCWRDDSSLCCTAR